MCWPRRRWSCERRAATATAKVLAAPFEQSPRGQGGHMSAPRYAIGIDLGTTHSALAYVDIAASADDTIAGDVLEVPQLSAPGTVEARPLLPSFLYLPHADELAPANWPCPGRPRAVTWSARWRAAAARRRRSAWCPAPRAGSATPASTAARRSCRCGRARRGRAPLAPRGSARYLEHLRAGLGRGAPRRAARRAEPGAHRARARSTRSRAS